jgi:tetratricopeptide (TPR) repeat protein
VLQRLARLRHPASLLLTLSLGCGARAPSDVPRTLHGTALRGAFVPPTAYEAYVRGELALARGRPDEAIAQLDLATTAPDEDPYLLSRLAHAQLLAGKRAQAEQTLDRAYALDPCHEQVWLMRGELAATRGDDDGARAAFAKASACAPGSDEGVLAQSALLADRGDLAGSLDVLVDAHEHGQQVLTRMLFGSRAQAPRGSTRDADPLHFAHAVASLSRSDAIERAAGLALERGMPRLSLRLREQHAARLPPQLEAQLLQANGMRAELAALLAQHDASELGGAARTAALALDAGVYERAELESGTALAEAPSDALHALHARASLALGDTRAAMVDARAITGPELRLLIVGEALAATGAAALGREISVLAE